MRRPTLAILICSIAAALFAASPPKTASFTWNPLAPGLELATIPAGRMASGAPGQLNVLRVDPRRAKLTVALASEVHGKPRTAAEWCRTAHLAAAINLGMFQTDQLSNVGYLRHGSHLNNPRWNADNAVLAFGPSAPTAPPVMWIDRDKTNPAPSTTGYNVVVQNLRLIARDRRNVWSENGRRWSEAALAVDSRNRLLFLFTRAPWSMRELNQLLLQLPLDVAGAMHLEGGPEASLSIHSGGVNLDLAGSYESGFWPDDSNTKQWPIPNVLGVSAEK